MEEFFGEARRLGACDLLMGARSEEELLRLLLTPQGVEFCLGKGFPSMRLLRPFRGELAESLGVYIEADVELRNPRRVYLAGCRAVLRFGGARGYNVVIAHGSEVEIHASDYAVVFVHGDRSNLRIVTEGEAVVL